MLPRPSQVRSVFETVLARLSGSPSIVGRWSWDRTNLSDSSGPRTSFYAIQRCGARGRSCTSGVYPVGTVLQTVATHLTVASRALFFLSGPKIEGSRKGPCGRSCTRTVPVLRRPPLLLGYTGFFGGRQRECSPDPCGSDPFSRRSRHACPVYLPKGREPGQGLAPCSADYESAASLSMLTRRWSIVSDPPRVRAGLQPAASTTSAYDALKTSPERLRGKTGQDGG